MPLQRLAIDTVTAVAAGTTSTIVSVTNSKITYVRTLIIHASSIESNTPDAPVNVQIYVVPNVGGNVGTASSLNRIARINLAASDTFFLEPEYPINLDTNGDSIQVFNEGNFYGGGNQYPVNVLAMGDRDDS